MFLSYYIELTKYQSIHYPHQKKYCYAIPELSEPEYFSLLFHLPADSSDSHFH